MAETLRCIAHIEKTHGRRGEVVAVAADGLPLLLTPGLEVALLPPDLKGPRWRRVRFTSEGGAGQLVSFYGVADLGAASKLVGKSVLARVGDLPADFALHDAVRLLGLEVLDGRLGSLGTVEEVMQGTAQDVWVVRGPYGEVLIPAVEPVVLKIGEVIQVDLPQGLVDEG